MVKEGYPAVGMGTELYNYEFCNKE